MTKNRKRIVKFFLSFMILVLTGCASLPDNTSAEFPSEREVPAILKSLDYDSFFPGGYKAWRLYENNPENGGVILKWINDDEHELELIYKKASHRTIQNVYLNLGNEVDKAIKERGGNLLKAQEFYALAVTNENSNMVSVNILYGTIDGAYLWRYKVPPVFKTNIDRFIKNLTFVARKEQYEKALASGNVIMGHWGKPVHEYARLLAEEENPDTEAVYLNFLRTSSTNYQAHIEFTSITKDKKKKIESARIVRRDAEDEKLLNASAKILKEDLPNIDDFPLITPKDDGLHVILIPLPPINPWILEEIAETFESITTIPVSIRRLPRNWDLPPPSRSAFRPHLERIASKIWPDKADFSDWSLDRLRKELMIQAKKEGPKAVSYLTDLYKKIDEEGGQWKAGPLVLWLSKSILPYMVEDRRTMYVGITDIDIYSGDSNFVFSLYGGADSPVSVLSCAKMKAKMTGENQSRRRLVERCAKELVPASLKRLGIPRSIDPSCPYSYADGLQRLDEKTLKLSDPVMEQILYERGLHYHEKGELDRALSDYNKAIDLNPDFSGAYNNRGNIYASKGEYGKAISDYTRAIEINPDNAAVFYNRGLAYKNKGDMDHSMSDFNRAIEINPKYSNAYFNRSSIYQSQGNLDLALLDYNKVIEMNPSNDAAFRNRGVIYQDQGELDRALLDYSEAIEINPENAQAYFGRGLIYQERKEFDLALSEYNRAIDMNPNYSEAYNNRGNTYSEIDNHEQAISDYNKAIEINPNFAESYGNRGNIFRARGNFDQAIADYDKAIQIKPEDAITYHNRGIAYTTRGKLETAIKDYSKAIELNPKFVEAYVERGITYSTMNEINLAISDYGKAIEINPKYSIAYINRGNAFWNKGEHDKAMSDYNKALEVDPMSAEAYSHRGFAYSAGGDLQRALSDLNRALEIDPMLADAYNNRGMTYGRKSEHNLAISDFNKALEIEPRNAEFYNNRGYTFKLMREYGRAISDFNRSIEINSKHTLAYINRGSTFYLIRDRNRACSDWKQACDQGECNNYMRAKKAGSCE